MLKSCRHKISNDNCECTQVSRLYSDNHRQIWAVNSYDSKNKQVDCRNIEPSQDKNNVVKNSEGPTKKLHCALILLEKRNLKIKYSFKF